MVQVKGKEMEAQGDALRRGLVQRRTKSVFVWFNIRMYVCTVYLFV